MACAALFSGLKQFVREMPSVGEELDGLLRCCGVVTEGEAGRTSSKHGTVWAGKQHRWGAEQRASYCCCVLAGKLDEKKPPEADMK